MRTSTTRYPLPGVFAFVLTLVGSIAVHAEVISVPPADPPSVAAAPAPPTVLRGSPLSTPRAEAICPPGYSLSPGYGCVGPAGDYAEGWPGYDYWPDYGYGWFPGFGFADRHFHRFAGFHGRRGFHGARASTGFHHAAGFAGFGHMTGGFGHR
jgi:hypothetical protein